MVIGLGVAPIMIKQEFIPATYVLKFIPAKPKPPYILDDEWLSWPRVYLEQRFSIEP
jgi:hypothetical protein